MESTISIKVDNYYLGNIGHNGHDNTGVKDFSDPIFGNLADSTNLTSRPLTKLPPKRTWNCLENKQKVALERTNIALDFLQNRVKLLYHNSLKRSNSYQGVREQKNSSALWVNISQFKELINTPTLLSSTYLSQGESLAQQITQFYQDELSIEDRVKYKDVFTQAINELNHLHKQLT